jgi:hypothetical protein
MKIAVKSERIARLEFSEGTRNQKYPNQGIEYLLPDVVLIIVLIVLFDLCYGVFNFLDELFSLVLHECMICCYY